MGAAGDMLSAALLELMPDPQEALRQLNAMNLPGIVYTAAESKKCGITGTHLHVQAYGVEENPAKGGADAAHLSGHEDRHAHDHYHDHEAEHMHDHHHDHEAEHMHDHHHDHEAEHMHDHHHDHGAEHTHDHHLDHEEQHMHTPHHDHEKQHTHDHKHTHHHYGMREIRGIIERADAPDRVKKDALAVYQLIAGAESTVHGREIEHIHFHEVGSMDAVADVMAVCYLLHELQSQRILASPVAVGSGTVKCAHGILPVPAPATALLLQGIPTYAGPIKSELCTPTGAALLRYFVQAFDVQPPMSIERIGYGCGFKDFPQANVVRALLGGTADQTDQVVELSCNLDDMSPEKIGFAIDVLFAAGALEVYTIPIGMKKNRPGILLTCMCRQDQREEMLQLIFLHTTTIGVRERIENRYVLHRSLEQAETRYGRVGVKHVWGYGTDRSKYEYEDLARIAREHHLSVAQVEQQIREDRS